MAYLLLSVEISIPISQVVGLTPVLPKYEEIDMRLTICLGLVWFLSLGMRVCRGQSAEALLKASGVQAGLIVHLDVGCKYSPHIIPSTIAT